MTTALTVRFFGTSTLLFDEGRTPILIDGFFSRPSLLQVVFGRLRSSAGRIRHALDRGHVTTLAAIFVAHSHYDHALDTATVANETGALVYGSESTANIARGERFDEQRIRRIVDRVPVTIGAFTITPFATPHSPNGKFPGTIDEPLRVPARASAYLEGGNYSFLIEHEGRRMLVVTSGNFDNDKDTFAGVQAETVFLSIGRLGRQSPKFARKLWRKTIETVGAKVVIPIHWDYFGSSLRAPLRPMPRIFDDVHEAKRRLHELAGQNVAVRFPTAFVPLNTAPSASGFRE